MFSLRGLISTMLMAGMLAVPLYFYWEYLTRGMRPSEGTLTLNRLEREGVPDFELKALDGRAVRLADFRGKITLVNVWATWCAPCVKEFPSMQRLVEKMPGKVAILAVSYDKSKEDIDSFIQAFGALPKDFVVVWDQNKITAKILGTDVLPETYILSPTGKLVRKVAGETIWDDPAALQFFRDLMDGKI